MDKLVIKRSDGEVSTIVFDRYEIAAEPFIDGRRVVVITDENVCKFYGDFINRFEHIVIGLGEENKTLSTAQTIFDKLIEMGADRKTFILGFGGGIVTDIAGFVASTFMRGVSFGFVATTLLAQVDASVGGKNGVNHSGYKNMVGVFNQPVFVVCDSEMFKTLPDREFRAGLAEIIKAGLIADKTLFEEFEKVSFDELRNDGKLITRLIKRSVEIKAKIVEEDEREGSVRKKLNLGHTFAHAIEKLSRDFIHGEAVSLGMVIIGDISYKMGRLTKGELERIKQVLVHMGLPVDCDIDREKMNEALKKDKKKENDSISLILYDSLGKVDIVDTKLDSF